MGSRQPSPVRIAPDVQGSGPGDEVPSAFDVAEGTGRIGRPRLGDDLTSPNLAGVRRHLAAWVEEV